jgi:hypothetical protein
MARCLFCRPALLQSHKEPEIFQPTFLPVQEKGKSPVLIIDQASKVLGRGEGQGSTSSIMSQILMLTKQLGKFDVIMASSKYAYPYTLEQKGFNLNDISAILCGWDPSKVCVGALGHKEERKWEQQPACDWNGQEYGLSFDSKLYGGHSSRMSFALLFLTTEKECFTIDIGLSPISNDIITVLELHPCEGLVYLW